MMNSNEHKAEKGTLKAKSGFKDNFFKRFKYKLDMMKLVLLGRKIIIVTYIDQIEKGEKKGIKAICKVSGMDYSTAITLTDQFITNEKVQMTHHQNLTLRAVIEAYGSMVRIVEDPKGGNKNYFDRVNMIAILNKKTYKTWTVINKPNQVEAMMQFASTIKLHYA